MRGIQQRASIIYCACQNHTFGKAHPICRMLSALSERVNLRDFLQEKPLTGLPKKICACKDFLGRGGAAARRRAFCDKQNADKQRRATTSAQRENPAQSLSANVGFSFRSRKFVSSLLKQISPPFRNLCKSKNRAFCFCTSQRPALPRER